MNLIEFIKKEKELVEKVMRFCDIEIYPKEQEPENLNGTTVWNIIGMAFACDASGGEYIFLNDNSIGFNSSEGDCGRIAENIIELFELLINIPSWMDYLYVDLYVDLYKDDKLLEKYIIKSKTDFDKNIQKELSDKLSIKLYENKTELLIRFYETANREPKYMYTFTGEDGIKINSEGSLINRPLYDHVKKRMEL
jgi:hypothetical protein